MQSAIQIAWYALRLPEETREEVEKKLYWVVEAGFILTRAATTCMRCALNDCATEQDVAWGLGAQRTWWQWSQRLWRTETRLLRELRRMGGGERP